MGLLGELSARTRRIFRRRGAYRRCFHGEDGQPTPQGEIVLMDLARFCGAYRSTVKVSPLSQTMDPMASAVAQGRREVWLHLQAQLHLRDEAVLQAMESDE